MKKLITYGSIVLGVLVCIQAYWFTKAFDANATEFDHTVSVALYAVADTMTEHASVEKRSSNYFYVTTNCPVSSEAVDTMIQKEFAARDLRLDYEVGVYNAEDDSLVHGRFVKSAAPVTTAGSYKDPDGINKNFAVLFPSRKSYLVGQLDIWIFTTFVLIFISWAGVHSVATLRQSPGQAVHKNQIRLGNSCLDFHNQSLEVNNSTYQLTYKENKILQLFFENPNQVIERKVFLEKIWEQDGFFVARSMDVFISRVRKYLSKDQAIKIQNLRAIGYRLLVSDKER